jgi:hypothetical protein
LFFSFYWIIFLAAEVLNRYRNTKDPELRQQILKREEIKLERAQKMGKDRIIGEAHFFTLFVTRF